VNISAIDAHGLKIQRGVHEVFATFWEEGYIGVVKIFGEGPPFWCFIAFLRTSFAKKLEGGYTFISPLTPPCVHLIFNVT
jgi:hypothetical protein